MLFYFKNRYEDIKNKSVTDKTKAIEDLIKFIKQIEQTSYQKIKGDAYNLLGVIYSQIGELEKAKTNWLRAEQIYSDIQCYQGLAKINNNYMVISSIKKDYDNVVLFRDKAIKYYEKYGDYEAIFLVYYNLVISYLRQKKYVKSYNTSSYALDKYKKYITTKQKFRIEVYGQCAKIMTDIESDSEFVKFMEIVALGESEKEYKTIIKVCNSLSKVYENNSEYQKCIELLKYINVITLEYNCNEKDESILSVSDFTLKQRNQKHYLTNLEKKSSLLKQILSTIPTGICCVDKSGNVIEYNRAFEEFTELTPEEILTKEKFLSDHDYQEFIQENRNILQSKESRYFSKKVMILNKKIKYIDVYQSLFYYDKGEVGILNIFHDKSKLKYVQQELDLRTTQMQLVLRDTEIGVVTFNRLGEYQFCNMAITNIFKCNLKNFQQEYKNILKSIYSDSLLFLEAEDEHQEKNYHIKTVFGDEKDLRVHFSRYKINCQEDIFGFSNKYECLLMIVDETKNMLIKRNLERSNQVKDKFFSVIGHDLRCPIGTAKQLIEQVVVDEQLAKDDILSYNKIVFSSLSKTYDLLENLLCWSTIERDCLKFQPEKIDVCELINNALNIVEYQAESKNIKMFKGLPKRIEIISDENMLSTVIRNIISNSIKFTPENGHIIVKVKEYDYRIEIIIRDDGIGIEKDKLDNLFAFGESFSTFGTNGERGSGLGLTLCTELINKMNGQLVVNSKKGVGSEFIIILQKK